MSSTMPIPRGASFRINCWKQKRNSNNVLWCWQKQRNWRGKKSRENMSRKLAHNCTLKHKRLRPSIWKPFLNAMSRSRLIAAICLTSKKPTLLYRTKIQKKLIVKQAFLQAKWPRPRKRCSGSYLRESSPKSRRCWTSRKGFSQNGGVDKMGCKSRWTAMTKRSPHHRPFPLRRMVRTRPHRVRKVRVRKVRVNLNLPMGFACLRKQEISSREQMTILQKRKPIWAQHEGSDDDDNGNTFREKTHRNLSNIHRRPHPCHRHSWWRKWLVVLLVLCTTNCTWRIGYRGTRVGEASNPGPPDYSQTFPMDEAEVVVTVPKTIMKYSRSVKNACLVILLGNTHCQSRSYPRMGMKESILMLIGKIWRITPQITIYSLSVNLTVLIAWTSSTLYYKG